MEFGIYYEHGPLLFSTLYEYSERKSGGERERDVVEGRAKAYHIIG
jgi:hypothetical protein